MWIVRLDFGTSRPEPHLCITTLRSPPTTRQNWAAHASNLATMGGLNLEVFKVRSLEQGNTCKWTSA